MPVIQIDLVSDQPDPNDPLFSILRLQRTVVFDCLGDKTLPFDGAIIDTGSPFTIVPFDVHHGANLKIYKELGAKRYRALSSPAKVNQRFVELAFCFAGKHPKGPYELLPTKSVRVRAFLLDAGVRPKRKVVIGLAAVLDHFNFLMQNGKVLLSARDELFSKDVEVHFSKKSR